MRTVADASRSGTLARCGVERWPIKTLHDPDAHRINFHLRLTTVRALRHRHPPAHPGKRRIAPVELQNYRVEAELVTAILEDDSDVHLVITDADRPSTRKTMIVELPDPACTLHAFGRAAMTRARRAFERACGAPSRRPQALNGRATITGVGFWDFKHGQTEVAPNAIELHPVTGFRGTSCRRQRRKRQLGASRARASASSGPGDRLASPRAL